MLITVLQLLLQGAFVRSKEQFFKRLKFTYNFYVFTIMIFNKNLLTSVYFLHFNII